MLHFPQIQRIVKKPRAKKQQEYDSDDPEAYGNEAIPDKVIFWIKLGLYYCDYLIVNNFMFFLIRNRQSMWRIK